MTWPGQKQWYWDQKGVNLGGFGGGCDRKSEGFGMTPRFQVRDVCR